MREAARKGLALRMEADRKKPWLRSQTPSPPGINVQLTELKVLREKAARLCEETRRVVSEYRNIVALRRRCRENFIGNLYALYEMPCGEHEGRNLSIYISSYLHGVGGLLPTGYGGDRQKQ